MRSSSIKGYGEDSVVPSQGCHTDNTLSGRHMNLALLQQYGSNSWRIHNYLLESTAKNLDKAVEDLKQLTVELNRERKNFQVRLPSLHPSYERPLILSPPSRPMSEHNSPRSRRVGPSSFRACYRSRWQM